ncbi:hypothetical protein UQW22_02255 [Isoptericola halotolerans]|uniref:hypothetical protein n=1 Tax=Isoptericola halotolerans TaxID=300560 RepID=UPI003890AE97
MSTAAHAADAAGQPLAHAGIVTKAANGALAGLIGGMVFGMLMAMMGMLPMVAGLAGSENAVVGLGVHLVNSAVIGAIFGLVAWGTADKLWPVLGAGMVYGIVWWVLGALILMPLWLSVTMDPMMRDMIFTVGSDQWMSLMGHVIFGLVTALVLFGLKRRRA